jgi:hypothetical protein
MHRLPRPPARASSALHGARLTSATGNSARLGVVFRTAALLPLTSDVAFPLPRRRVNDAGFNASSKHLRSLDAAASPLPTLAGRGLPARSRRQHATGDTLERARRHSPTSAIDATPEHTGETIVTRRRPAFNGVALRLAAPRRCEPHRPLWTEVSAVRGTEPAPTRTDIPVTGFGPRHTGA